jgi:hypothetical protein
MTTGNFCFYFQNRLIQTSQAGGQQYSDTSPFCIPCLRSIEDNLKMIFLNFGIFNLVSKLLEKEFE